jgi:hypothetical protein
MRAESLLSHLPGLTADAARRWIAASLAEVEALRAYDDQLYPPADDPASLGAAEHVRAAWRQWADEADALLARVAAVAPPAGGIPGVVDLDRAVAGARAMLKLSPQTLNERRRQVDRGDVLTAGEARRELGLKHRP